MAAYQVLPDVLVGSRRRITIRIDFGETMDLLGLAPGSVKLYMRPIDFSDLKINGANCSVTDVSGEVAGAPTKSIWDIYYNPAASDVDTPGRYVLSVVITFSGGVSQTFPDGDYVYLTIKRGLA